MSRRHALAVTALITAVTMLGRAQSKPGSNDAFEVASVKPTNDVSQHADFQLLPGGRVTLTNFPLHGLIRAAYASDALQLEEQIIGPAWIRAERFDIVAKAEGSLAPDETGMPVRLVAMMRSLVEERFRMQAHTEMREMSVYLLVLANRDRALGPRLHQSSQDCRGVIATASPEPPDSTNWCGVRGGVVSGHIRMRGLTMAQMATRLAADWEVRRPVLDRTGLAGRWDGEIEFVPVFLPGPHTDSAPVANPNADSGPTMLSAVQGQLGLKLEPTKAPVQVLVIDHVERPTSD
jgi:bla regulator protein blaR1